MSNFVKPHWIRLFPSDFLAGCTLLPGRQRTIYAYLLIMQADMGAIKLSVKDLADHIQASETDVQAVLDIKFDFNPDINGFINKKMADEVSRAGGILARKTEGAAKARAKKETRVEQNRTDSDINVDINADIKTTSKARATIDDLRAYSKEKGLSEEDGEAMFYHLEANGWKNGKNPVKCWKSTFSKWKANGWHPSQKNGTAGDDSNSLAAMMKKENR